MNLNFHIVNYTINKSYNFLFLLLQIYGIHYYSGIYMVLKLIIL